MMKGIKYINYMIYRRNKIPLNWDIIFDESKVGFEFGKIDNMIKTNTKSIKISITNIQNHEIYDKVDQIND